MRIVTNERHVRIHKLLATITSLLGVALLFISILLPVLQPEAGETPPLPLVLVAIAFSATGLRLSLYWLRAPIPHDALDQGLKGLGSEAVLYHYHLPSPHVLVCPQGVFSLTVVPQRVAVQVEGSLWRRTEGVLTRIVRDIYRQDSIGNPAQLAERQAKRLQDWLGKYLPGNDVTVQPIVVFSSPEATLSTNQPRPPVLYADKRKPSLKATIRDMPRGTTLSPEQITALEETASVI